MDTILIDGLSFAMRLLIMAIGGIYCERSGVTMLALEGLQGFGAFAGSAAVVLLGFKLGAGHPSLIYIAMAVSMAGGLVFALIHAALCVKFRAQQVISGVVVNTLAMALTTFLTSIIKTLLPAKLPTNSRLAFLRALRFPASAVFPFWAAFLKICIPLNW